MKVVAPDLRVCERWRGLERPVPGLREKPYNNPLTPTDRLVYNLGTDHQRFSAPPGRQP